MCGTPQPEAPWALLCGCLGAGQNVRIMSDSPTSHSIHTPWELWAKGSQTPTWARHGRFWPQNQLGNFQNSIPSPAALGSDSRTLGRAQESVLPGSLELVLYSQVWDPLGLARLGHFNPVCFLLVLCNGGLCVSRVEDRPGSLP